MSFLKGPKLPTPSTPPDPADLANRMNTARTRRIAGGGANATFLSATADAPGATKPTATLTGLNS
jgi:hypothetical protein